MNVLCVIPARGGSVRIPKKNLAEVGGMSLVMRAYRVAERTPEISRILVSTDCRETAALFPERDVVDRPAALSGPTSDIAEAILHALRHAECVDGVPYDAVVTLQPAVPVRSPEVISAMLRQMVTSGSSAAVTGVPLVPWVWSAEGDHATNSWSPGPYPRSQDCATARWQEVNSVQIALRDIVLARMRWALPLVVHLLPPYACIDIDTPHDLARARWMLMPILEAMIRDAGDGYHVIQSINGHERAWA